MRKLGLYGGVATFFILQCLFHFGAPRAEARTLRVPSNKYSTIQSAIDAAKNGDVVLVSDGAYQENIDFGNNSITVQSENGPAVTTIDGSAPQDPNLSSVVVFMNNQNSRLEGFTLTGGTGTDLIPANNYYPVGGGIYIDSSSPVISNCVITGNTDSYVGGGMFIYNNSNVLVEHSRIESNTSTRYPNGSGGSGGGMYVDYNNVVTITHSRIENNHSDLAGGGIYFYFVNQSSVMQNSIVANNTSGIPGMTAGQGGGLYYSTATVGLRNCTITGNSTQTGPGGGIYTNNGGGIYKNTIIYDNLPTEIVSEGSSAPTLNYCNIKGGWPYGSNNIDVLPEFNADYSLQATSQCIDAGYDLSAEGVIDDIVGTSRPQGLAYDIGAYEYAEQVSTIVITRALYDYVGDTIEVEATSNYGANAALELQGYGALDWNGSVWHKSFSEIVAPGSVTVCGIYDGCTTQD